MIDTIPLKEDIKIGYICEIYIPGSGDDYETITVNQNNLQVFENIFHEHLQNGWLRKINNTNIIKS